MAVVADVFVIVKPPEFVAGFTKYNGVFRDLVPNVERIDKTRRSPWYDSTFSGEMCHGERRALRWGRYVGVLSAYLYEIAVDGGFGNT